MLRNVEDSVVKQMENCNFSLQNPQHSVVVTELTDEKIICKIQFT